MDSKSTVLLVTDVNSMDYVERALATHPGPRPTVIAQYKGSVDALSKSRRSRVLESFRNVDLLLCLTPDDAQLLRSETATPIDWITNPVPEPAPVILTIPKVKRFVTMSRLSSEKGLLKALTAWANISTRLPGWEFVIYGEGSIRSELEKYIDKNDLYGSARLAGATDTPLKALREASALVLPSEHEGFGMVIAEAASVGTPTIAFDCSPGVRIQIESGENGLLVQPGNINDLAASLFRLAVDPDYTARLGTTARVVVTRFSVARTMSRWDVLLGDAMRHRQGAGKSGAGPP